MRRRQGTFAVEVKIDKVLEHSTRLRERRRRLSAHDTIDVTFTVSSGGVLTDGASRCSCLAFIDSFARFRVYFLRDVWFSCHVVLSLYLGLSAFAADLADHVAVYLSDLGPNGMAADLAAVGGTPITTEVTSAPAAAATPGSFSAESETDAGLIVGASIAALFAVTLLLIVAIAVVIVIALFVRNKQQAARAADIAKLEDKSIEMGTLPDILAMGVHPEFDADGASEGGVAGPPRCAQPPGGVEEDDSAATDAQIGGANPLHRDRVDVDDIGGDHPVATKGDSADAMGGITAAEAQPAERRQHTTQRTGIIYDVDGELGAVGGDDEGYGFRENPLHKTPELAGDAATAAAHTAADATHAGVDSSLPEVSLLYVPVTFRAKPAHTLTRSL